jgi:hypothetical protein
MSECNIEENNNTEQPQRKRGRKRKGYFYEEEEAAFVKYINSTDKLERDRIFKEKLYPAFTKMVESIIRRYNLFTPSEDFDDTFHDTMSFLMTKVNNYDVSKGYKVYSYCGTICKNYLILKRTQDMKHTERFLQFDNTYSDAPKNDTDTAGESNENLSFNSDLMRRTANEIKDMLEYDDEENPLTDNERKVGMALIEILLNWDEIFKQLGNRKFNKTSVLFFIREYTLLSPKEVRVAMKRFKCVYFALKEKMLAE